MTGDRGERDLVVSDFRFLLTVGVAVAKWFLRTLSRKTNVYGLVTASMVLVLSS